MSVCREVKGGDSELNKAETSAAQIVVEWDATEKAMFLADFKSLVKTGTVNCNLITAFTGFGLALYFTGAFFCDIGKHLS